MTEQHQQLVDKWLAGKTTLEEQDELWAQALDDTELYEYIQTTAGVKKVLELKQQQQQSIVHTSATFHQLRYWYAAAAIVILSVGLGYLLKIERNPYEFELTSIELIELESPMVSRSSENRLSTADSLLNLGIKAIVDGKKKRALELLTEIVSKYPDEVVSAMAFYNLGILEFNSGKFSEALTSFSSAIDRYEKEDNKEMVEKATWFKAHTLLNLNQAEAARDEAARIFHMDGVFRKKALLLAKKIDQKLKHKKFEDDVVAE